MVQESLEVEVKIDISLRSELMYSIYIYIPFMFLKMHELQLL